MSEDQHGRVSDNETLLCIIRHGQSTAQCAFRCFRRTKFYRDAALTKNGIRQARSLPKLLLSRNFSPDLIVCSALTRALQTACLGFEEALRKANSNKVEDVSKPKESPTGEEVDAQSSTSSSTFPLHKSTLAQKIIVRADLCEVGDIPENHAREVANLRKDIELTELDAFSSVDFGSLPKDWPHAAVVDAQPNVQTFLAWLKRRPEKRIAIVSHSSFIKSLLDRKDRVLNAAPIFCTLKQLIDDPRHIVEEREEGRTGGGGERNSGNSTGDGEGELNSESLNAEKQGEVKQTRDAEEEGKEEGGSQSIEKSTVPAASVKITQVAPA